MSTNENKDIARRFFEEQDRRKGPFDPEMCAPDYTARIGRNPPMDLPGHSQFGLMWYAAFPDLYHMIDEAMAEDDKVAVRFTLRGTHKGNLMGIPPTDKEVAVTAIAIMRIVGGKVAELQAEFDALGLMQQLGAISEPAHA